jgi:hypothetical protein
MFSQIRRDGFSDYVRSSSTDSGDSRVRFQQSKSGNHATERSGTWLQAGGEWRRYRRKCGGTTQVCGKCESWASLRHLTSPEIGRSESSSQAGYCPERKTGCTRSKAQKSASPPSSTNNLITFPLCWNEPLRPSKRRQIFGGSKWYCQPPFAWN